MLTREGRSTSMLPLLFLSVHRLEDRMYACPCPSEDSELRFSLDIPNPNPFLSSRGIAVAVAVARSPTSRSLSVTTASNGTFFHAASGREFPRLDLGLVPGLRGRRRPCLPSSTSSDGDDDVENGGGSGRGFPPLLAGRMRL